MALSQYKDIFGKPNEGVHSVRFAGMAAFDLMGLVIVIIALAYIFSTSAILVTAIMIPLTICIHALFGVDTAFNKWLLS